ncbi:MAG: branched-chain amino acid transport system II carrier protein, partial [Sporomusa sp.]
LGATASTLYTLEIDRGQLIVEIIRNILGFPGIVVLGIVVALACITTAIALVSATATYFSRLANNRISYQLLVIIICVFSTLVSNVGLSSIIATAAPILGIIYPGALTLIILSFFGNKIQNNNVFKCATVGAILVSALVILEGYGIALLPVSQLPLVHLGFGWILPTVLFGFAGALIKPRKSIVEVEDAD